MKNLIKLSRELVENLLNGNKQKLGKEYFFMFSISKFVLLKERILKKDSTNNILYFNNVKNAQYIPAILSFADEIKKNGISIETNHLDKEALIENIKDYDVLVVRSATKVTSEVLEAGAKGNLKLVVWVKIE